MTPASTRLTASAGPAGALAPAARRRVLAVLCATEIVSWGVLYYAFPVLATQLNAETGWSSTFTTAAFSAGLLVAAVVGIPVGRWLDTYGPRWVMSAGSVLAGPSIVLIALAPNPAAFAAGWIVAGIAMAAVLYPPAFTALTRWYGPQRVKALTMLTLAAGLASTVFAPLTAFLVERLDWRETYLVLAAVVALITVPAHWWGLRVPWPPAPRDDRAADGGRLAGGAAHTSDIAGGQHTQPARIARSLPFVALVTAVALTSFTAFAVLINLVPLLIERGMTTGTAALALGLGGAGQVVGRIGYPALTRLMGVRSRTVSILLATAVTTGVLGLLAGPVALVAAAVVAGMARGLLTLVQATAVSDRWGAAHYGRLTGLLSAPVTVSAAIAPWAGAAIADVTGGYTSAFLILAAVGLVGAGFATASVPSGRLRSRPATDPAGEIRS